MMHFKQILVVKETRANEGRVALTPQTVATLVKRNYRIWVETGAGVKAGFTNADYINAGAELFTLTSSGFPPDTFIVRVLRPSKERELLENNCFQANTAMLGFLFPFVDDTHMSTWQRLGLTTLSFDLFKSISIHDPKNAQAAMSRIAGRLAFQDALKHYNGKLPAKLTIIGTGPAAMSAVNEALKHPIPVQVFGRQEQHRTELEALGITYYVLPTKNPIEFIQQYLGGATLIITAARAPGKKAPLLIDAKSLSLLPAHANIVDLAASNGGNVFGTQCEQIITIANDIRIISVSGYPKTEPRNASEAYAQCVLSVLTEIMSPIGAVSFQNKWVQEIWVTHKQQRHDTLYSNFHEYEDSKLQS